MIGNITLAQNFAYQNGGGIWVPKGSLSSRGHISFTNNLADYNGGGLTSLNSNVKLEGSSSFLGNTATHGGDGLYSLYSNVRFIRNTAKDGGGIATVDGGSLTLGWDCCG